MNLGPKLHSGVGFFKPWFFYNLENSHQDLSDEGSNFILSLVEVGHLVVQTFLKNHLKLQILASYTNLRIGQDSEFAKFWPRALTM